MGPKNFNNTVDQHKLGTNLISSIRNDVSTLKTTVGDTDSGLVKDVDDLSEVVGDSDSGLIKDINDLNTAVTSIPIVSANPSGTATDTLSSLKVDDVVYGISGGGGGGNSTHLVELVSTNVSGKYTMQDVSTSEAKNTHDIKNWIDAGDIVIFKLKTDSFYSQYTYCYLSGIIEGSGSDYGNKRTYMFSGNSFFRNTSNDAPKNPTLLGRVILYWISAFSENTVTADYVTLIAAS